MHVLCMMLSSSNFLSHLGVTKLVNKIKIYDNFIELFLTEIYFVLFLFKSPILIRNKIREYHLKKYIFIIARRKSDEFIYKLKFTLDTSL